MIEIDLGNLIIAEDESYTHMVVCDILRKNGYNCGYDDLYYFAIKTHDEWKIWDKKRTKDAFWIDSLNKFLEIWYIDNKCDFTKKK